MNSTGSEMWRDRTTRDEELDVLFGVINRFIGYFTRQAVPRTGNDTSVEYPFVAMDTRQAYEQLLLARSYLEDRGLFRPGLKCIDIGCGIGNILLIAELLEFDIFGIEKDPASLQIARNLVGEALVAELDIWSFERLADFDVLYYFRPFCEKTRQLKFERLVEQQCKPGAILIANRKMDEGIDNDPHFDRISKEYPIWRKISR
jgi:SAM-dependent methyltransferase